MRVRFKEIKLLPGDRIIIIIFSSNPLLLFSRTSILFRDKDVKVYARITIEQWLFLNGEDPRTIFSFLVLRDGSLLSSN